MLFYKSKESIEALIRAFGIVLNIKERCNLLDRQTANILKSRFD